MAPTFTVIISLAAFAISVVTAWLTLFQLGTVKMSRPSIIFLGPDGKSFESNLPKIYLRSILYATSKRGRIVENMFARLHRGETSQTFSVWVYGEGPLARGSGVFVGETGIACNHHFLLQDDSAPFSFLAGEYTLEVYASLVGDTTSSKLFSTRLTISQQQADKLREPGAGIYFDWRPESRSYFPSVRSMPQLQVSPSISDIRVSFREPS